MNRPRRRPRINGPRPMPFQNTYRPELQQFVIREGQHWHLDALYRIAKHLNAANLPCQQEWTTWVTGYYGPSGGYRHLLLALLNKRELTASKTVVSGFIEETPEGGHGGKTIVTLLFPPWKPTTRRRQRTAKV